MSERHAARGRSCLNYPVSYNRYDGQCVHVLCCRIIWMAFASCETNECHSVMERLYPFHTHTVSALIILDYTYGRG